jgi:hypothetical protein
MGTTTDSATIERAGRALIDAIASPARVILIQDAKTGGELRFLVIEPKVTDRFGEMARLSELLGQMLIPADVVVVDESEAEIQASTKGTLIHEALRGGQIVAES